MQRLAFLALVWAACSPGNGDENLQPCGPNGECSSGYSCDIKSNFCRLTGGINPVDGPAAGDAGSIDAGPHLDGAVHPDAAPGTPDARVSFDARLPDAPPPDAPPAPAVLTVDPDTQDFGMVTVGDTSPDLTFTVTNGGGLPSGMIDATVSDTTSYTVTGGTCAGASLAGGKSCTVLVRFNPTGAGGSRPATLHIDATPGGSPTASLTATALTAGQITLTPTSKTFDPLAVGLSSDEASFTVTNTGESASGALGTSLIGSTDFTISSNDCPDTLAAGATCHLGITYTPSAVGHVQGISLSVSAAPGGSAAASLQGTGTADLTVTNAGGGTVTSAPDGISCGDTCTATFGETPVVLTATPDGSHQFGGWMGGGCSGTDPCSVSLSAATTVTASFLAVASLSISPTDQPFGSITLDGASMPQTFTVTNAGDLPSGMLSADTDSGDFVVTGGTCLDGPVDGQKSCTVIVEFVPTSGEGDKSATLTVSGTPGGSPMATLHGTALTAAQISLMPSSVNFDPTGVGGTSAETFLTVKNDGESETGTLSFVLSDPTHFTLSSSNCPSTLGGGASCMVGVESTPTAAGASAATLSVGDSPADSVSAALMGTGTAQVLVSVAGNGTVASTPAGLSCTSSCMATFSQPVSLMATPDPTFVFTGWGGACSGTGGCDLPLDVPSTSVTAGFDCPAGLTNCGTCVDTTSDGANCGGCGNVCPSGSCSNSACDITFKPVTSNTKDPLVGIWGTSKSNIWAVGGGPKTGTIVHFDGSSWKPVASHVTDTCGFEAVWGVSASSIWAVGCGGTIAHWNGDVWAPLKSPTGETLFAIWGSSATDIWAAGQTGVILHSTNGVDWTVVVQGPTLYVQGLWGAATKDIWAVGQMGSVLHYTGDNWVPTDSGLPKETGIYLEGVWGTSARNIWAVGDSGTLDHYDGDVWKPVPSGTTLAFYGVWGSAAKDVYAVGFEGAIFHFDGDSWSNVKSPTQNTLHGVWGASPSDVWIVGDSGTILHGP